MFFFMAGLRPKTMVLASAQQVCPTCGDDQAVKKRTDDYLSLFFLPIIPIKKGGPHLDCSYRNDNALPSGIKSDPLKSRLKNRCAHCGRLLEPEFSACPYCGKEI